MPTKKVLQVIPKTLTYTPTGGTATVFTDFAEAISFTYEDSYADISSQSSDYAIGKVLTGRSASLKAVVNNFDLAQMAAVTNGTYAAASDSLTAKSGSFNINAGAVVFVGYDTTTGKDVTITLAKAVATVSGDISFGKDKEATVGLQFDVMRDTANGTVWTIVYAI